MDDLLLAPTTSLDNTLLPGLGAGLWRVAFHLALVNSLGHLASHVFGNGHHSISSPIPVLIDVATDDLDIFPDLVDVPPGHLVQGINPFLKS